MCPSCAEICGADVCNETGSLEEVKEANQMQNEDIKEECGLLEDNSIIRDFLQSFQFKL